MKEVCQRCPNTTCTNQKSGRYLIEDRIGSYLEEKVEDCRIRETIISQERWNLIDLEDRQRVKS